MYYILVTFTVKLLMDITQLLVGNVCVYLSRGNVGMTKHDLDRADISAIRK